MVTQPSLQSDFMSCTSAALSLWWLQTHTHMSLCYTTSAEDATVISQAENITHKEGGQKCGGFLRRFCNGSLQKISLKFVNCNYGSWFMFAFTACVLLTVNYTVVRRVLWMCESKLCSELQRRACVCVLHQFHWPTKRGVEQMSWLCSTLIGHSLRLYPHFNWYNAV